MIFFKSSSAPPFASTGADYSQSIKLSAAQDWRSRISSIQNSKVTPEQRQSARARFERQTMIAKSASRARKLEATTMICSASNMTSLRAFKSATANMTTSATRQKCRAEMIQSSARRSSTVDEEDEEYDGAIDALTRDLQQENAQLPIMEWLSGTMSEAEREQTSAHMHSDIESLLDQLKIEQTDKQTNRQANKQTNKQTNK